MSRRQLVVSDGIGRFRRERAFDKPFADIRRLVILGHEGAVTLEALRWMNDAGIVFLQIDRDGQTIAASTQFGLNDSRLRRALALARDNSSGFEIARYVLSEKLKGQAAVLRRPQFAENAVEPLTAFAETARNAAKLPELLLSESLGAAAYWEAWRNIELRFARKDEKRTPTHWKCFGQRGSPITGSPRLAINPANAMLNYLYALLEQETRIACLACGLDPGMGIFHADQKARDSLALDLMEAARPKVDKYLLELLEARTFATADFTETRKGVCRVLAPLTHELAETVLAWRAAVAPVVERTAKTLMSVSGSREVLPTPLTQTNRSAGRDGVRRNPRRDQKGPQARKHATCQRCGGKLPRGRQFCDSCLPEQRQEQLVAFETAGPAALAEMRADGRDPAQAPAAKRKLGKANTRRNRERREWNRKNERPDPEVFTREILPLLQNVSLTQMMEATGLSVRHCSRIRRGYVPHARHWQILRFLGERAGGHTAEGVP